MYGNEDYAVMKVLAGKYFIVFLTQIKNLAEYKVNITLKLIRPLIMTLAVGSLWWVLFEVTGRETIGKFSRLSFVIYLLTIRFIAIFSPGGTSITNINEEIRTGNITMRLVRPIHYLLWLFCRNLPIPLVCGVTGVFFVTILSIGLGGPVPRGWLGCCFVFSVLGTILIQYAIYQGIGILSFWIYEVFPLERFYVTVNRILSGELIPLTLFGATAQEILQYLPFACLAFIPGGIFTGIFTAEQAALLVTRQFGWAAVLWIAVIFLYRKGLRKYEAQGG